MLARWIWNYNRCKTTNKRYKRTTSWSKACPPNNTTSPSRCPTAPTFRSSRPAKNLSTIMPLSRTHSLSQPMRSISKIKKPLTMPRWTMYITSIWQDSNSRYRIKHHNQLSRWTAPQVTLAMFILQRTNSNYISLRTQELAAARHNSSSRCSTFPQIVRLWRIRSSRAPTSIQISSCTIRRRNRPRQARRLVASTVRSIAMVETNSSKWQRSITIWCSKLQLTHSSSIW